VISDFKPTLDDLSLIRRLKTFVNNSAINN